MPKQRSKFDESIVHHFDRAFHTITSKHQVNLRYVLSPYLHNLLLRHAKRHEIDFLGYSYELIGITSYYLKSSYVYRYKTCDNPAPTHFYQLLIALSAFGKSTVHTLLKTSVMNEYSVRTNGNQYDHRKSTTLEGFDTFVDETSAAGLQAGLANGDKMIFSDEGENILKNNGLLVDENTSTSSTYDLHNFVLSYYGSLRIFNKELKSGSLATNLGRLTISCLSTSEPIIRMLARRFSGGATCPMLERFTILYAETKPKYSFQRPKTVQHTMASLSQFVMVLGQIHDIDFYFDEDAENLYALYGDALTFAMKQHERNAPWLSTRFGKSRDHSLRLCALIQGLEMAAVVCHEVFLDDPTFVDGFANKRFFNAAVEKTNQLFFSLANNQRCLCIGIEVVQGAIYLTNKIIDQYREMFEPNKRELNRMELSIINEVIFTEQKQVAVKRTQNVSGYEENNPQNQVESTSTKHSSKKLTNKKVREDEAAAKSVEMFDPMSEEGIKIIKLILLVNGGVLTKSAWSRHPTLKNYIPLLVPALEYLVDNDFLFFYERGAVVTSNVHRFVNVYVKRMISPLAAKENMSLAKLLNTFKIEYSEYIATWSNICLSPTITLTEKVYLILSNAPYSTFIANSIVQWAPKSQLQASSITSGGQTSTHVEVAKLALPTTQAPTTSSIHLRTNIMSKEAIDSSSSIIINNNNHDAINKDSEKNTTVIRTNKIMHQKQQMKSTTTNLAADESEIDQENRQRGQMDILPMEIINPLLPVLPTGNLPTAVNLMLTRQPPLKKKKK